MSDSSEKLQQELEPAQCALAETQARNVLNDVELQGAIIELNDARKSILRAHQEWMAALDVVEDPIFMHDKDFHILRCNRAYQQRAGIPFEQIIGQPYYSVYPKSEAPMCQCRRAMENWATGADEEEILVGDTIYRSRAFTINDRQGGYLYSVHMLEDITERKATEESLVASHALLQTIIENAPIRVFWKDTEACYLGCNTAFARDAGLPGQADVIGKDDFQMNWREQAELYRADDKQVMDSGKPKLGFEEEQTTPDGNRIWLRTSKVPLHASNGKVIGLLGIYEDITERRQAEERLKLFRTLIDNSSDFIEVIDFSTRRFIDVNDTLCLVLGYSREEMLSKNIADIDPMLNQDLDNRIREQIFHSGAARFESMHARKDGSTFPVEVSAKLVKLDKPYVLSVVRDITERRKADAESLQVNRVLKTLSAGNRTLLRASDEKAFMTQMCEVITSVGEYPLAWIGLVRQDGNNSVEVAAIAGEGRSHIEKLCLTGGDWSDGRPMCIALHTGKTQVVQNTNYDSRFGPWCKAAVECGYASKIALPLKENGVALGVLNIYSKKTSAFNDSEVDLLGEVADDLAFGLVNLRTRMERNKAVKERKHYVEQLRKSLEDALQAIATTVEMRDPYTAGHQRRVAQFATAIARQLGLPEEQVHGIFLASVVHDIGKVLIPAEVLSKPGRLNEIEYSFIKTHSQAGYDILKGIEFPWPIAQAVLQHHERLDGSGYPQGSKGDAIILEARILGVADVVEAMSSHRPYRPGLGVVAALEEVIGKRGVCFDPQVVDACLALFREQHFSFTQEGL
ncbi:MAG: PAS domain S-box protein [Thiobacillaceae bacterium]